MNKIDMSTWKEFYMKDLGFENYHGIRIRKQDRKEGEVPLLTAGKENQGVASYIASPPCAYTDSITVDMFGNTFFHNGLYSGDDNIYFFINDTLSEKHKLFISSILNAKLSELYAFKDQFRQPQADELSVPLPVDENQNPDWNYMESYITELESRVSNSLENLESAKDRKTKEIDISTWKEFFLGGESGLFNIVKGKRLTKANMVDGDISFIGSTAFNNGITAKIGNNEHLNTGNAITVNYNGSIGEAFYQKKVFWASDDVNVFYPKFEMTENIAYFLIPLIKEASKGYAYIEKWTKEEMEKSTIYLPVNSDSSPDWEYMDSYIQRLKENVSNKLYNLS